MWYNSIIEYKCDGRNKIKVYFIYEEHSCNSLKAPIE